MRKYLSSLPIRNKVLIFGLFMSTIPLLLMSLYYYTFVKNDLEKRIVNKQELTLQVLTNEIELEFNQTFQQIQMLTALKNIDMEASSFYELLQQNPTIEEVVITNEKGYVEQRTSRFKLNLPLENETWFTDKMWFDFQYNDKVYGDVEFNEFGQPVMKMAIPFFHNEERMGVGVIVQLQKIIGKISSARQDDHSSYLYLVDQNDRVIAHQDYRQLWQQQSPSISKDMIGVKEKLPDLQWTLVMEQPVGTAYEPINELLKNGLIVVAIFTLVVSLISIYAGLYFTTPIIILERAMEKLKLGYQIKPVEVMRTDELGNLAAAFNGMSAQLQEKSLRLEQEKERLDVVVNGIGAGFALVTKEYEVTWLNSTLMEWLDEKQLTLPCYSLIRGQKNPCLQCPISCPELANHADRLMKYTIKDGSEKIFRHRVFPLTHTMREEGEYLLVIEDVTEQKQMEEKMIQTDKLSALGIMASSFAHEVNNPLTTINVYAEDLIDRFHTEELEQTEMEYYLRKIKDNTDRCKQITRNLLNFSRKSNWTISQIDLHETINNSIELVDYLLKKHHIKVQTSIEAGLPPVFGDSLKFMQVLVNLLNNSIDAMEDHGVIYISAKMGKSFVVIKIVDTGKGIVEEDLARAFDPFYTTKPVGKGTGLGLSVCYGIIQQLGGEIYIDSEIGEGTTVKIRLPVTSSQREDAV